MSPTREHPAPSPETPPRKYEFTGATKEVNGHTLRQIRLLIELPFFRAGILGGWIEDEKNLSQSDSAWVYGNARVSPINIDAAPYPITITDTEIQIGCQCHPLDEWDAFNDATILRMDGARALKFWRQWKPALMAICAVTGRPLKASPHRGGAHHEIE